MRCVVDTLPRGSMRFASQPFPLSFSHYRFAPFVLVAVVLLHRCENNAEAAIPSRTYEVDAGLVDPVVLKHAGATTLYF